MKYFLFFLFSLLINIYAENVMETRASERIKNTIISMLLIESEEQFSFALKFKKIHLNFTNFAYFDIPNRDFKFSHINHNGNISLNDMDIIFKSDIIINFFNENIIEFLIKVHFDKIIFNNNNNENIQIVDAIPKSLNFSDKSQIGQLSYFKEFNQMKNATLIKKNGEKIENVNIESALLDISKTSIINKIKNVQLHFNFLTYDLNNKLNSIIGEIFQCSKPFERLDKEYVSFSIEKIDIPLNSISITDNKIKISDMKFIGFLYYEKESNEYGKYSFSFFVDERNEASFEQNKFNLTIISSNIICDDNVPKEMIKEVLISDFLYFLKLKMKGN
jgi:hypothetical protein